VVYRDENSNLDYKDGYDTTTIDSFEGENLLTPVFCDGKMEKEQTLQEIRGLLHEGEF